MAYAALQAPLHLSSITADAGAKPCEAILTAVGPHLAGPASMPDVHFATTASPAGPPRSFRRVAGARLSYSGGRGVIETEHAEELRAALIVLDCPFLVEQGRVGLDGCRLDVADRTSALPAAPRSWWSRRMHRTQLPRHALAFSYTTTYDTAEVESLLPPAPRDDLRRRPSWV
jgi:hypothetical protein